MNQQMLDAFLLANGGQPMVCSVCKTRSPLWYLPAGHPGSGFYGPDEDNVPLPLGPDEEYQTFYCLPCLAPLVELWHAHGEEEEDLSV